MFHMTIICDLIALRTASIDVNLSVAYVLQIFRHSHSQLNSNSCRLSYD